MGRHKLIDSHVHLLDPRLRERAEEIIKNFETDDIEFVVEISADVSESHDAVDFANSNKNVYCTIGVHPIFAETYCDDFEAWAQQQVGNQKVVAIGECGFDYYHMETPAEHQRDVFVRQIKLAHAMGLPLVVHARDAFDDTFAVLNAHKQYLNNGLVLHCFSGGADEVERFKALDAYFAFGGAITYKNSVISVDAIRAVPRDRLMVETDCPYLAPVPIRGTVNEPKNVRYVAEHIAGILGLTFDEVAEITSSNTKRFYRIIDRVK